MMEIVPLGDSALIVRMRERFDDAPEQTLDTVLRAFQQLQNAAIPGVIELAPAYTSVTAFFDPISVAKGADTPDKVFDLLAARIRTVVAAGADRGRLGQLQNAGRLVEIPVCYDPEFALDIDDVARRAAIPSSEVSVFTAPLSIG
jgi:inhibitor of KinA